METDTAQDSNENLTHPDIEQQDLTGNLKNLLANIAPSEALGNKKRINSKTPAEIQFDIAIIEKVKEHPELLYAYTDKSLSAGKTSKIWKNITEELKREEIFDEIEFSVDVVKTKWSNIRNNFKRSYEKAQSSNTDCRYIYYEMMDFLKTIYDRKQIQKEHIVVKPKKNKIRTHRIVTLRKKSTSKKVKKSTTKTDYLWTQNDKIKFLKILERFPELYNSFDPEFRNTNKKAIAITVIINLMKLPQFYKKDNFTGKLSAIREYLNKTTECDSAEAICNNVFASGKYLIECSRQKKMINEFEKTYSTPSRTDMFWSKADTLELLQVAESFPAIWNESHIHFQSIQHRMTVYSAIKNRLEIPKLCEVELMKKFFGITAVIVKKLKKRENVDTILECFPSGKYLVEHLLELQENRKNAAIPFVKLTPTKLCRRQWTTENTIKMVELMEKYPSLWNEQSPFYNCVAIRNLDLERLALAMNVKTVDYDFLQAELKNVYTKLLDNMMCLHAVYDKAQIVEEMQQKIQTEFYPFAGYLVNYIRKQAQKDEVENVKDRNATQILLSEPLPVFKKPTSSINWDNIIYQKLLKTIEAFPVIWNSLDKSFAHDKRKQTQAMNHVSELMCLTGCNASVLFEKFNLIRRSIEQRIIELDGPVAFEHDDALQRYVQGDFYPAATYLVEFYQKKYNLQSTKQITVFNRPKTVIAPHVRFQCFTDLVGEPPEILEVGEAMSCKRKSAQPITDSKEFLTIVKDYPNIWNDDHADYMDKNKARCALAKILQRYGNKSYDETIILQRLTRCRTHIVAFVKEHLNAGDDVLFEKLSRSVYPFYMIQYLNFKNDLGISEEVLNRLKRASNSMKSNNDSQESPSKRLKTYPATLPAVEFKIESHPVAPIFIELPVFEEKDSDLKIGSASCRLCLEELTSSRRPLTTLYHNGFSYAHIYRKCTGHNLLIDDPDYPLMVCDGCDKELLTCYAFLEKSTNTEERLRTIFKSEIRQPGNKEPVVETCKIGMEVCAASKVLQKRDLNDRDSTCRPINKELSVETCETVKEEFAASKILQKIVLERNEVEIEFLTEADLDEQIQKQLKQVPTNIDVDAPVLESNSKIKVICYICGKMVKKSVLRNHIKHHTSSYSCDKCGVTFKGKQLLVVHMQVHVPLIERYVHNCPYCPKKFTNHTTKNNHIHGIHFKTKKYVCSLCSAYVTRNKKNLIRHMEMKHINHNAKPKIQCEFCEKAFKTNDQLNHHMSVHSDEKPVTCEVCSKDFKSLRLMKAHYIIHTGEKNYVCPVCSQAFAQNHVLRTHVTRTHPGYALPVKGTIVNVKALARIAKQAKEAEEAKNISKLYLVS